MSKEVKLLRLYISIRADKVIARREEYLASFVKIYKIQRPFDETQVSHTLDRQIRPEQLKEVTNGSYGVGICYYVYCLEEDFEACRKALKEKCTSKLLEIHQKVVKMKKEWEKYTI
jgi:hypothetical protein